MFSSGFSTEQDQDQDVCVNDFFLCWLGRIYVSI